MKDDIIKLRISKGKKSVLTICVDRDPRYKSMSDFLDKQIDRYIKSKTAKSAK